MIDMNVEIVKQEKNELEFKIDNLNVAEILRVYLNRQGIDFAAWRREHPSKPIIFRVQSKDGAKKEISEAIKAIGKDLDKIKGLVKK